MKPRTISLFFHIFAAIYLAVGLSFLLLPHIVFAFINWGASTLGMGLPLPPSAESFWLPLAFSMMMMLTGLSLQSARDPEHRGALRIQILSKFCSVFGFIYLLMVDQPYFAYGLGAIVDASIAAGLIGVYLQIPPSFEDPLQ